MWTLYNHYAMSTLVSRKKSAMYTAESEEFNSETSEEIIIKYEVV